MLFITICFLSSCLSLKNSLTGNIDKLSPVEVEFIKLRNIKDENLKDYNLEDKALLDTKVSIKETDKYYNDLPLVYKSRYTIYDVKINTISFIAIEPKKEINLRMLAGQRKLVEEQVRLTCVIFLDTSTAYKKESFIEKGVPFVIKGKQIYLPFLGIALANERNKEISPITLISFLTQKMIFVAMYEKWRNITATEAAKKLDVTRMSANRCFDEIQYLGIKILDMKGKSRVISIPDDIEKLWQQCLIIKNMH